MRALNYVLLQKGLNEVHCDTTMQIQTGPGLAVTAGIITPAQLLPNSCPLAGAMFRTPSPWSRRGQQWENRSA